MTPVVIGRVALRDVPAVGKSPHFMAEKNGARRLVLSRFRRSLASLSGA
jgi:hypothetical protein